MLKKFLNSSLFVTKKLVNDLGMYCIDLKKSNGEFDYVKTFKVVFSEDDYDKRKLDRLFSELFKAIEDFIVYLSYDSDKTKKSLTILAWYNNRNLTKFFAQKEKEISTSFKKNEQRLVFRFYDKYQFEAEKSIFQCKIDKRTNDVNFQSSDDSLDKFYLVRKLIGLCLMLNREKVVKIEYDKTFMDDLLQMIPKSIFFNDPYIQTYFYTLKFLLNPGSKDDYDKLYAILRKHQSKLAKVDVRQVYVYLENESRVIFSHKSFFEELFRLYKEQIELGVMLYRDRLLSNVAKNVVVVALRTQHEIWANDFIEEYKDKIIPVENRQSVYSYCKAEILFSQQNYMEALAYLANVEEKDVYLLLSQKRLYVKIWFDTQNWTVLEAHLNALRVYIHRSEKIDEKRKEQERIFINTVATLYKYYVDPNKDESDMKKLSNKSSLEKKWIDSKIDQLKK